MDLSNQAQKEKDMVPNSLMAHSQELHSDSVISKANFDKLNDKRYKYSTNAKPTSFEGKIPIISDAAKPNISKRLGLNSIPKSHNLPENLSKNTASDPRNSELYKKLRSSIKVIEALEPVQFQNDSHTVKESQNIGIVLYNLSTLETQNRISDFFSDFGPISKISMPLDPSTGMSMGIALIEFSKNQESIHPLRAVNSVFENLSRVNLMFPDAKIALNTSHFYNNLVLQKKTENEKSNTPVAQNQTEDLAKDKSSNFYHKRAEKETRKSAFNAFRLDTSNVKSKHVLYDLSEFIHHSDPKHFFKLENKMWYILFNSQYRLEKCIYNLENQFKMGSSLTICSQNDDSVILNSISNKNNKRKDFHDQKKTKDDHTSFQPEYSRLKSDTVSADSVKQPSLQKQTYYKLTDVLMDSFISDIKKKVLGNLVLKLEKDKDSGSANYKNNLKRGADILSSISLNTNTPVKKFKPESTSSEIDGMPVTAILSLPSFKKNSNRTADRIRKKLDGTTSPTLGRGRKDAHKFKRSKSSIIKDESGIPKASETLLDQYSDKQSIPSVKRLKNNIKDDTESEKDENNNSDTEINPLSSASPNEQNSKETRSISSSNLSFSSPETHKDFDADFEIGVINKPSAGKNKRKSLAKNDVVISKRSARTKKSKKSFNVTSPIDISINNETISVSQEKSSGMLDFNNKENNNSVLPNSISDRKQKKKTKLSKNSSNKTLGILSSPTLETVSEKSGIDEKRLVPYDNSKTSELEISVSEETGLENILYNETLDYAPEYNLRKRLRSFGNKESHSNEQTIDQRFPPNSSGSARTEGYFRIPRHMKTAYLLPLLPTLHWSANFFSTLKINTNRSLNSFPYTPETCPSPLDVNSVYNSSESVKKDFYFYVNKKGPNANPENSGSFTPTSKTQILTSRSHRAASRKLRAQISQYKTKIETGLGNARKNLSNNKEGHSSQTKETNELPASLEILNLNSLESRTKDVFFAKSGIHNYGLFTREHISSGEFVIEYIGERIRSILADHRETRYAKIGFGKDCCYLFRVDHETVIDATLMGNIARFVNHSCDPNCIAKVIVVDGSKRIGIYAKTDIKVGDEITYDYKFSIEDTDEKIPCLCGAATCRGFLN
ncbi:hypothetical protein BB560_006878 [Smittium megazygosporum]|uniref:[histone H3]-lysine(4) N-trimethyltransferase n=1 Tax=Smittium megazygosporum TaxID=133381 RepID=A0A2T9Y0L3_9FUNG|nr:hypothetical protein BB560_006878 [Smittium megazygosporum]